MSLDAIFGGIIERLDRLEESNRKLETKQDQILLALPPQLVDLKKAKEALGGPSGPSIQTITKMFKDGRISGRRAGRRILIDLSSLRPVDANKVAQLAVQARGEAK